MNCNKCGRPIEPNVRFCGECGATVEDTDVQQPGVLYYQDTSDKSKATKSYFAEMESMTSLNHPDGKTHTSAQEAGENGTETSFVDGESVYQPLESGIVYDTVSTKRGFGSKGFIIAALVVMVVGIAVCLFAVFYPQIMMSVMNPQEYYLTQERKVIDGYKAAFGVEAAQNPSPIRVKGETSTELSSSSDIPKELTDILDKLNITYDLSNDTANGLMKGTTSINIGDKSYIDMIVEMAEDRSAVSVPEWGNGKVVSFGTNWLAELYKGDEKELIAMTGMNRQQLQDVAERVYRDVVILGFPKEAVVKNGNEVSFTINEATIKALAGAMHKHMEQQRKVLLPMLQRSVSYLQLKIDDGYMPIDNELVGVDVTAEYDEMLENLKAVEDGVTPITINSVYKVTYDKRGKLISRNLRNIPTGEGVTLHTYNEDGVLTTNLVISNKQDAVLITNNHSYDKDGNSSGDISITAGENEASIAGDYSFVRDGTIAGYPAILGHLAITLNSEGDSSPGAADFSMTFDTSRDKADSDTVNMLVDVTVKAQEESTSVKIKSTFKYSNDADVSGIDIPKASTVDEDEYAIGAQAAMEALMVDLGLDGLLSGSGYSEPEKGAFEPQSIDNIDLNSYGFSQKFATIDELVVHIVEYDYDTNPDDLSLEEQNRIIELITLYSDNLT